MKKPELLAPAGSFSAAYHALGAGADGVYLGLKDFSARKAAQNFSLEQLRRVRRLTAESGKNVYVAINTIVADAEMPRLAELLCWLEALAVDAVIVQDLGVAELLATRFPRIPVHASTQMAVHNDLGLRVAEDLGIRRVILSRELPLARIRALRERHPGIELEVFIHGALCYSFSGICLASWALTGRSGNRGDCAQICRSRFRAVDGGCAEGHFFSCRDLFLGREVLSLAEIGVDALKIEGRMKSPEYVFNVTRLYRQILDQGERLPEEEYQELQRRADLGFARKKTTGWLHASSGRELIESRYPGHRGVPLGTASEIAGREMILRLDADLSLRDGVGYFLDGIDEPVIFSVSRIVKAGREVRFARAGEKVGVEVPLDAGASMPLPGVEVRHFSSRFLDLPQPKETGFPAWKIPLEIQALIGAGGSVTVCAKGFPELARQVTLDTASTKKPFAPLLERLFSESGDSLFTLGGLSLTNATGLGDDEIFIPPSELKKLKNDLYALLDKAFLDQVVVRGRGAATPEPGEAAPGGQEIGDADREALSHRQILNPPRSAPVPFAAGLAGGIEPGDLVVHAGFHWLPLPPVIMEEAATTEVLQRLLRRNPGLRFAIGLNNISHCAIAADLSDLPNAWFFADFSLYVANVWTVSLLRRLVPRLLFSYSWIEGEPGAGPTATVPIAPDFRPPLFYSLGCYVRHMVKGGACFDDCPRNFTYPVRQGRNRFTLIVRDCVTYMFKEGGL